MWISLGMHITHVCNSSKLECNAIADRKPVKWSWRSKGCNLIKLFDWVIIREYWVVTPVWNLIVQVRVRPTMGTVHNSVSPILQQLVSVTAWSATCWTQMDSHALQVVVDFWASVNQRRQNIQPSDYMRQICNFCVVILDISIYTYFMACICI